MRILTVLSEGVQLYSDGVFFVLVFFFLLVDGVSLLAKLGKKAYNPARKEIANLTPSRKENQCLPLEPEQFIYSSFKDIFI